MAIEGKMRMHHYEAVLGLHHTIEKLGLLWVWDYDKYFGTSYASSMDVGYYLNSLRGKK